MLHAFARLRCPRLVLALVILFGAAACIVPSRWAKVAPPWSDSQLRGVSQAVVELSDGTRTTLQLPRIVQDVSGSYVVGTTPERQGSPSLPEWHALSDVVALRTYRMGSIEVLGVAYGSAWQAGVVAFYLALALIAHL